VKILKSTQLINISRYWKRPNCSANLAADLINKPNKLRKRTNIANRRINDVDILYPRRRHN